MYEETTGPGGVAMISVYAPKSATPWLPKPWKGLPSLQGRDFQNLGLSVANPDKGQYAILPYHLNGNEIVPRGADTTPGIETAR